ncbi:MAG: phosphoribosylanthranilate isomerase [Leptospirales bacterium]|jgi:phosphoribosylanthranilate isomerase
MFPVSHYSSRKLVKVCGNRYPEDAWRVAACRPDFMGWIFSPRSRRRIPLELATRLIAMIRRTHPQIRHVGVLAGNSVPEIRDLIRRGPGLDFLQIVDGPGLIAALEGARGRNSERRNSLAVLNSLNLPRIPRIPPILPVIRVRDQLRDSDLTAKYGDRPLWLMDSYVPGQPGGTGRRFAPELVSELRRPFLLAGGLNEHNVREALEASGARGADVSSGIEYPGCPGRKDPDRLLQFVQAVRGPGFSL